MRYAKPVGKLVYAGSRALIDHLLRKSLHANTTRLQQHNEYPVFLMHGFMGFTSRQVLNWQFFDYFNGVTQILQQMGYSVYLYEVDPLDTPQNRAVEWARHVDRALKDSGAEKLHIIAHSQGAIDARVLAADTQNRCLTPEQGEVCGLGYGDKIASLTSLGGPHLGTPIADHSETRETKSLVTDLVDFIALLSSGQPARARRTLKSLSRDFMVNEFNPNFRMPNTIPCYTVAANPLAEAHTSYLLDKTWHHVNEIAEFDGGGANDGLVPVSSAMFEGADALLDDGETPQWQSLGQVTTDHMGLAGVDKEIKQPAFCHMPMFVGLCQNIDSGYRQNLSMALQTDGEWRRSYHPHANNNALERSVEMALKQGVHSPA